MQARYWILTIKAELFQDANQLQQLFKNTNELTYLKGQLERGGGQPNAPASAGTDAFNDGTGGSIAPRSPITVPRRESTTMEGGMGSQRPMGFLHWQVVAYFKSRVRLGRIKSIFGNSVHAEPTRSNAAADYVWKDESSVGDRFEFGTLPDATRNIRNNKDWEAIKLAARAGRLDDIPADVYCRNYNTLKRIVVDHMAPVAIERSVKVYWGATGVGKSRLAWNEAGLDAYPKDPRSKFWDGYSNQSCVVVDEFRGGIDISHILRWFDRYPVIVEVKGSSTVLSANKIWITSNLHPRLWYPDIDDLTFDALMRRLTVFEILSDGTVIEEMSRE